MYLPRLIIFTDGSINAETGCAGSAAIIHDTKKRSRERYMKVTNDGTNNVGELVGIEIALSHCMDYKEDTPILIISDSKYSLEILQKFCSYYKWMLKVKDKDPYDVAWVKKENEPYKNQELIKKIHKKYLRIFTDIKYIHTNSHLSPNKPADVKRVIEKFKKQGLDIDAATAKALIEGNSMADKLAKEACN